MASQKKYRYPGINFFTKDDQDIFCGRADDAHKLFNRIMLNNTVVLHGESGAGKSSLVQAGILPLMEKRNIELAAQNRPQYLPVTIRFDSISKSATDDTLTDNGILIRKILHEIHEQNGYKGKELPYINPKADNLWYTVKSFENNYYTFLLIFDQFEELQGYNYRQVEDFAHRLSELFVSTMPESIYLEYDANTTGIENESRMNAEARKEFNGKIKFLEQPLDVRILFVVREDKLGTMSLLSDYFPDILKNDFLLLALNEDNARNAISEPSEKEGNFISAPFKITKSAEDSLINNLEDADTGLFDPIQLQIVCSNIERKIAAKKNSITADDIPPVGNIIRDFYDDTWADIQNKFQLADDVFMHFRKEMISVLVINSKRNLAHGDLLAKTPLHAEIASALVEVGLLRRIPSGKETFFQLCHDRFIEPMQLDILNINAKEEAANKLAQEKQELIRYQEEEKQKAAEKQKEINRKQEIENIRKRQRYFKRNAFILSLLIIGGVIIFLWQSHQREIDANRNRIIAIMTALQRTGNPTLSYLIGRDWYEKNDRPKELNILLQSYNLDDGTYLSGIIPSFNNVEADIEFSDDGNSLKYVSRGSNNNFPSGIYTWSLEDSKIESITQRISYKEKIQVPLSGEIYFLDKDHSNDRDDIIDLYDKDINLIRKFTYKNFGWIKNASFSPNGDYLLINNQLYNFSDGKQIGLLPVEKFNKNKIPVEPKISIFLNDNKHIAVAYSNDTIKVFQIEGTGDKAKINLTKVKKFTPWYDDDPIRMSDRYFTALTTDKKGRYLFAASSEYNVEVFALDSTINKGKYGQDIKNDYPNQIFTLDGHNGLINCMAISNNDSLLLTGSADNNAILWSLNSFKSIERLTQGKSAVDYVAFSKDDKNLLTRTSDSYIYTWKRGKVAELYDKNKLFRFSPFEYLIWNLDEKIDGKLEDTNSAAGLFKATINYILNIQTSKEYLNENKVVKNVIDSAYSQVKNMFWALEEKKNFKDSISSLNRRLLITLFNNLSIDKYEISSGHNATDKNENLIRYYQKEGWRLLLIDTLMFGQFDDLSRALEFKIPRLTDSIGGFDKAYKYVTFFRDTLLKYYLQKDKEQRGMHYVPMNVNHFLFEYYLYKGDTINAKKIIPEILKSSYAFSKLGESKYDVKAYQIIIYLSTKQYDKAKQLYTKDHTEINETRTIISGDFFGWLTLLIKHTNAQEEIKKFMKEFKIVRPPI